MNECPRAKKVKCTIEEKKVKGWSTEELKDKANSRFEIDTERRTQPRQSLSRRPAAAAG